MDSCAAAAPLSNHGITGEEAERPLGGLIIPTTLASSSPPAFSSDDEDGGGSSSSFCSSTSTLCSDDEEEEQGEEAGSLSANSPLSKMSDLMAQLPIKRGLSRHYNGKSQSYTFLASVTSIHDLPKPERGPARKKLKSCRSYGGGMVDHVGGGCCHNTVKICLPPSPAPSFKPAAAAVVSSKIGSPSSSSSLQRLPLASERSGGFLRSSWRPPPPTPQHRPGRFPANQPQALLFA